LTGAGGLTRGHYWWGSGIDTAGRETGEKRALEEADDVQAESCDGVESSAVGIVALEAAPPLDVVQPHLQPICKLRPA
jgi:hypothetical protein